MKRLLTAIAICAAVLVAAGATPTPAAADGGRHGSSHFVQGSNGHLGFSFILGDRNRAGFRQRSGFRDRGIWRHHKLRRHQKFQHHHARARHLRWHRHRPGWRLGQSFGRTGLATAAGCHPAGKQGFDRRGQRVFGGVMCTNAHGAPYFVDGSRYIVRR